MHRESVCRARAVTHECPSELGGCGLSIVTTNRTEGHPRDASLPRRVGGVRCPELGVLRGARAGGRAGGAVRAPAAGRRATDAACQGGRERAPEGPGVGGGDGQQPTGGAGDRRDPAPEGLDELRAGRPRLVADALAAATAAGAGGPHGDGLVVLRADSAFYSHDVVAAARRAGAHFSITARSSTAVSTAIASIRADAWTPIHYPNAVWDEAEQRLISDAEIAEVPFTAFTSRRTADHISGRLIVRRVKRLNPTAKTVTSVAGGDRQGELFALYRYHAVFTDSPLPLVQAEKTHRCLLYTS